MIAFLNNLVLGLANIVLAVLEFLPQSPFTWQLGALGEYWEFVAYFFPFAEMVTLMTAYISGVITWYIVRWVLRFVKYIQ